MSLIRSLKKFCKEMVLLILLALIFIPWLFFICLFDFTGWLIQLDDYSE